MHSVVAGRTCCSAVVGSADMAVVVCTVAAACSAAAFAAGIDPFAAGRTEIFAAALAASFAAAAVEGATLAVEEFYFAAGDTFDFVQLTVRDEESFQGLQEIEKVVNTRAIIRARAQVCVCKRELSYIFSRYIVN